VEPPKPTRPRVADMRPGDYFGALFLTVAVAIIVGILAALLIAAWLATNTFHTTTPVIPTFPP
jgi:multidrug efflux pump subunit AcrB